MDMVGHSGMGAVGGAEQGVDSARRENSICETFCTLFGRIKRSESKKPLATHTYTHSIQEAHRGKDAYTLHPPHENSFRDSHGVYVCAMASDAAATINTSISSLQYPKQRQW